MPTENGFALWEGSYMLGDRYQVAWLAAITAAVAAAAAFACRAGSAGSWRLAAVYGGVTGVIAVAGAVRAWRDGELVEWVKPAGLDVTLGCFTGGFLLACAYAFTKYVVPPTSPRVGWLARAYLQMGDTAALHAQITAVTAFLVFISIAEELVWRGLVTTLFAELVGSRRAWIFAALLYAAAHLPTVWLLSDPKAGPNPLIVLAALGCGFVWGALTRWKGRLVPAIVSHLLFDWCVVMMFRFWGPSV